MKYNIAIIGAYDNVGKQILSFLLERRFPIDTIEIFDSKDFEGKELSFGDRTLRIKNAANYDFSSMDFIFSCNGNVPSSLNDKSIVITSYNKEYPAIIPEINPSVIKGNRRVCSPCSAAIPLIIALKPLDNLAEIKRIVVCSHQAASDLGKEAMDELFMMTKKLYENENPKPFIYNKQIAFNLIPQIGVPVENGLYSEEQNIIDCVNQIFGRNIPMNVTCLSVPVFNCHSESIAVEFNKNIDLESIKNLYENDFNIFLLDRYEEYVYATPRECQVDNSVYISRLRKDNSVKYGINLWVVNDNLRKGSALNFVQIAELYLENL